MAGNKVREYPHSANTDLVKYPMPFGKCRGFIGE